MTSCVPTMTWQLFIPLSYSDGQNCLINTVKCTHTNLTPLLSSTVHNTYIGRVKPTGYSNTQRADRQTERETDRQTDR